MTAAVAVVTMVMTAKAGAMVTMAATAGAAAVVTMAMTVPVHGCEASACDYRHVNFNAGNAPPQIRLGFEPALPQGFFSALYGD